MRACLDQRSSGMAWLHWGVRRAQRRKAGRGRGRRSEFPPRHPRPHPRGSCQACTHSLVHSCAAAAVQPDLGLALRRDLRGVRLGVQDLPDTDGAEQQPLAKRVAGEHLAPRHCADGMLGALLVGALDQVCLVLQHAEATRRQEGRRPLRDDLLAVPWLLAVRSQPAGHDELLLQERQLDVGHVDLLLEPTRLVQLMRPMAAGDPVQHSAAPPSQRLRQTPLARRHANVGRGAEKLAR
mmetsp:Transcript_107414/g.331867  ORF Transcript_107414/g.331867 Transcript_107414/m.331867 type:complete len:238 (+) Transcript_107414:291-1004(+)